MRRRHALPIRWPALIAVLLALLLRAGVPDGYMIGSDAAGAATLTPCPGRTMVMTAPHGHQPGHDGQGQGQNMPCPFGQLSAPALASAPPSFAAPAAGFVFAADLPAPRPIFLPQAAAPPPPATGPPARR